MAGNQWNQGATGLRGGGQQQMAAGNWVGDLAKQTAGLGNQLKPGVASLMGLAGDTASGKYLDPKSNPFLKGSVETALGDVTRKYTQEVMPQMGSAAQRSGAYGGSRQGIMEGLAAGEYQPRGQ